MAKTKSVMSLFGAFVGLFGFMAILFCLQLAINEGFGWELYGLWAFLFVLLTLFFTGLLFGLPKLLNK